MITYNDWQNGAAFTRNSSIDSEIYEYFLGVLPPVFIKSNLYKCVFQVDEPCDFTRGGMTYVTCGETLNGSFVYLGELTHTEATCMANQEKQQEQTKWAT